MPRAHLRKQDIAEVITPYFSIEARLFFAGRRNAPKAILEH